MATLTKTQLEHAKGKVDALVKARIDKFLQALGPRPTVPRYSDAECMALINSGQAKLLTDSPKIYVSGYGIDALRKLFDFPRTKAANTLHSQAKAWDAAKEKGVSKINAIKERVIDELVMSPDGMEALKNITAAFA
jgi:hypothetical protein